MLGRVVVPIVDVECLKRCPAIAMVKSIPKADRGIGKRVSKVVPRCLENSYSLNLVSRRNCAHGGK